MSHIASFCMIWVFLGLSLVLVWSGLGLVWHGNFPGLVLVLFLVLALVMVTSLSWIGYWSWFALNLGLGLAQAGNLDRLAFT